MFNNIPPVTKNLILINVLIFIVSLVGLNTGNDLSQYIAIYDVQSPFFQPYQVITHMFSHSTMGIQHIFFNMFLLFMFGSVLERFWGAKHFFIFYMACGLGSALLDGAINAYDFYQAKQAMIGDGYNIDQINYLILNNPEAGIEYHSLASEEIIREYLKNVYHSSHGASGALFGLSAAFLILFPNTPMYAMFIPVPIKAKYLIGAYMLYELYAAFKMPYDNIGHWAHIGGAITGVIIVMYRRKFNKKNFY